MPCGRTSSADSAGPRRRRPSYAAALALTDNGVERAFLEQSRARAFPDDRLGSTMKVHLVDGTYELFRHFFGAPPHRNKDGLEVAAARGVLSSVFQMLTDGATHVGVATDHVIESFRNDLWPGYKTGEGIDPDLRSQFSAARGCAHGHGSRGLGHGRCRSGRCASERCRRRRR